MDTIFGLKGKDFVILGADRSAQFSIVRLKDDEDKITPIDNNKILAAAGEASNRDDFSDLVQKNIHLYYFSNGVTLSTGASANFIRTLIAEDLRKSPSFTDLLLGGFDEEGASLYYLDYLGVVSKVDKAAHGYGGNFLYGLLDHWWNPEMSFEEAKEVMAKCAHALRTRFLVAQPHFVFKCVDSNGVHEIELS